MYLVQDKIDSIITLLEGMISSIEKFQHTSTCAAPTVNAQLLSTVATGRTVVSNIQNFYLEELYLLHQRSNVHGFYQQFEAIRTRVLSMQLELLEEFFISLFTNELHKDVQTYVQGFCPCTVLDAYHVVCIHEYSLQAGATPPALTVNAVLPLQFCSSDALSDVDEAANSMHPLVVSANNEHTMVDVSDGVSLVVDNAKFYQATGILSSVPAEIPTTTGKEKEPTCLEYTNRSDELLTFYMPVISVWNLVPVRFSVSKHALAGTKAVLLCLALKLLLTYGAGIALSARILVPLDYVSSSWLGSNIALSFFEPHLQFETAASILQYDTPAWFVVSAYTWKDLFALAIRYTVCFDPGITDYSVASNVHNGSTNTMLEMLTPVSILDSSDALSEWFFWQLTFGNSMVVIKSILHEFFFASC